MINETKFKRGKKEFNFMETVETENVKNEEKCNINLITLVLFKIQNYLSNLKQNEKDLLDTISFFNFLNRKEQVMDTIIYFIKTLWSQMIIPTAWKGKYAVFSDQMFGSGKTYFGRNLIQKSMTMSQEINEKLINLIDYDPETFNNEFKNWYPKILQRILKINQEHIIYSQRTKEIIQNIIKSNHNDLFFHIDELIGDENQVINIWSLFNSFQSEEIKKDRIIVYYFSGKNTLMNNIGSNRNKSPTLVKWILLPSFTKIHVKEIVLMHFKGLNIKMKEDLFDNFCQILTEYSGGIPGIIEYIYNTFRIIKKKFSEVILESEDDIKEILMIICKFISKNALDIKSMNLKEPDPEIRLTTTNLYSSPNKIEISSKIVYVKIGKDGKLRDLPALKEETFDELKKLIENEYPENETIKKGEFEVFDEEELPVSKDTSVKSLKEKSKLQIELKK